MSPRQKKQQQQQTCLQINLDGREKVQSKEKQQERFFFRPQKAQNTKAKKKQQLDGMGWDVSE